MKSIFIVYIIGCISLFTFLYMPSEENIYNDFKDECDELYGVNNWSEYSLQYITIRYDSNLPLYTKYPDFDTITCFKTGTTP